MMEDVLTVTAAFEDFRGNLEITGLQESLVAARQERVRAAVARGLTVRRFVPDRLLPSSHAYRPDARARMSTSWWCWTAATGAAGPGQCSTW